MQIYAVLTQNDSGRTAQAVDKMRRSSYLGGEQNAERMQRFIFAASQAMKQ